jgi:hypothetical protein
MLKPDGVLWPMFCLGELLDFIIRLANGASASANFRDLWKPKLRDHLRDLLLA